MTECHSRSQVCIQGCHQQEKKREIGGGRCGGYEGAKGGGERKGKGEVGRGKGAEGGKEKGGRDVGKEGWMGRRGRNEEEGWTGV